MGGGAWPFLVGGLICLVNSDNERDLFLFNSLIKIHFDLNFLGELCMINARKLEAITGL